MTPQIALDLSLDGIIVLSRAPDGPDHGKWWREGMVRLDAPDLPDALARLRDRCVARVGEDFASILVLPDSQLMFTSLERDDRDPKVTIRSLLRGRTPYDVEDLSFDYVERGDRLQVAVVATETLAEAEAFAADHGFRPVAIIGNPTDAIYPGIPDFGTTSLARDLLGGARLALDLGDGIAAVPAPDVPGADVPGAEAKVPIEKPEAELQAPPPADPEPQAPEPEPEQTPAPTEPDPGPQPEGEKPALRIVRDPATTAADVTPPARSVEEPMFARPARPAPPPGPPTPAFSSRRKGSNGDRAADDPKVTRIAPRLSAPVVPVDDPEPLDDTPLPDLDAPVAPPRPKLAPVDALDDMAAVMGGSLMGDGKPSEKHGGGGSLAARASGFGRRLGRREGTARTPPAGDDAIALALPGLAREQASQAGQGASRRWLYVVAALLLVLGALAFWLLGDRADDAAPAGVVPAETAAPEDTDTTLLLPDSSQAGARRDTADAGPADPPLPVVPLPVVPLSDPQADALRTIATARNRATGDAPVIGTGPAPQDIGDVYVASIDPVVFDGDAVALPRMQPPTDAFAPQTVPAPAGTAFDTNDDGLVVATEAGTLAPGGYRVVAGRPDIQPRVRPEEAGTAETASRTAEDEARRIILSRVRPAPRPDDASEQIERAAFSGLSRAEITRTRPEQRPDRVVAAAAAAQAASDAAAQAASEVAEEEALAAIEAATAAAAASLANAPQVQVAPAGPSSGLALARSVRPGARPRAVEQAAARYVTARREQAAAASASTASQQPAATSADQGRQTVRSAGGSVARAATQSNALRMREMNLIGVYGQPQARRALVRMPNGRYVKVKVGDQLDRGRVTGIGESELSYQRGGRSTVLRMPQG
ncbi:hypothetical protein [Jannaschia rubra]|uniref:hypothetical protein n=1 Tax=Jannaschia rubra TaxID=282197 RepID=UPI0024907B3F|nr:hypothetical protein [Jannaschia rubra]